MGLQKGVKKSTRRMWGKRDFLLKGVRAVYRVVRIRLYRDRGYQWGLFMRMAQILITTLGKQAKLLGKDLFTNSTIDLFKCFLSTYSSVLSAVSSPVPK